MPILLQLCREKLGWEPNEINILSSLVGPGGLNEASYNYSLEQCKALQHLSSFRKIDPQFLEISRPMSLIMELVACVSNIPFYSCSSLDCLLLFGVCQFLKTDFVVWAFYKHFFFSLSTLTDINIIDIVVQDFQSLILLHFFQLFLMYMYLNHCIPHKYHDRCKMKLIFNLFSKFKIMQTNTKNVP